MARPSASRAELTPRRDRGRRWRLAQAACGLLALSACASQLEPARNALFEVQGSLATISADSAKYAAEPLRSADQAASNLRKKFEDGDYAAVLADAPAALDLVRRAATAAAARKATVLREQNAEWTRLATAVPELLQGVSDRRAAAAAASLWSKAVAAFASGNLEEAVGSGRAAELQAKTPAAAG